MKFQERYKLFAICVILNIVTFMIRNTLSVAILDMTTSEKPPTNSSKSCGNRFRNYFLVFINQSRRGGQTSPLEFQNRSIKIISHRFRVIKV